MNISNYFSYWGINENPFQAEEARNDVVYQRIMTADMTHPDFEKIYGSPVRPSTVKRRFACCSKNASGHTMNEPRQARSGS